LSNLVSHYLQQVFLQYGTLEHWAVDVVTPSC
jgi:hypothetical protein